MTKLVYFRMFSLICALVVGPAALAETFPNAPITFIIPSAAGSTLDQLARAVGKAVAIESNVSVIVDNRPGANFNIAAQAVARAKADGYTIFFTSNTSQAVNPHLFKKLSYDPVKDFSPVAGLALGSYILLGSPNLQANNVAELLALAKERPGKLTFGSGTSATRVAGELFKQLSGTDLLHVPYKSVPFAVTDLLGAQIDLAFVDTVNALPQIKAGKVKALGVTTAQRSPLAPEIPTLSEAGVKGYELTFWVGTYVPAGTPQAVVTRLNELLVRGARSSTASQVYRSSGMEIFTTSPEGLRTFQADELTKWGRIIKGAGMEPE